MTPEKIAKRDSPAQALSEQTTARVSLAGAMSLMNYEIRQRLLEVLVPLAYTVERAAVEAGKKYKVMYIETDLTKEEQEKISDAIKKPMSKVKVLLHSDAYSYEKIERDAMWKVIGEKGDVRVFVFSELRIEGVTLSDSLMAFDAGYNHKGQLSNCRVLAYSGKQKIQVEDGGVDHRHIVVRADGEFDSIGHFELRDDEHNPSIGGDTIVADANISVLQKNSPVAQYCDIVNGMMKLDLLQAQQNEKKVKVLKRLDEMKGRAVSQLDAITLQKELVPLEKQLDETLEKRREVEQEVIQTIYSEGKEQKSAHRFKEKWARKMQHFSGDPAVSEKINALVEFLGNPLETITLGKAKEKEIYIDAILKMQIMLERDKNTGRMNLQESEEIVFSILDGLSKSLGEEKTWKTLEELAKRNAELRTAENELKPKIDGKKTRIAILSQQLESLNNSKEEISFDEEASFTVFELRDSLEKKLEQFCGTQIKLEI